MVSQFFWSLFLSLLSFGLLFPPFTAASEAQKIDKIPNSILSVSSGYVVVVDKQNQKLHVFKKNGSFSKVFSAECSTGKNQGSKQVSGDAKTPHGIFFATKIIFNPGPPETYGTVAFPLDYPSIADKKAGRNGTNIWIHGTLKPLSPFQSNGCVVLTDQDAHKLLKYIQAYKTPVIIDETISWVEQNKPSPVKSELENVLASWMKGYMEGDIQAIDALYLQETKISGKKRTELINQLSAMRHINQHFVLSPRDVSFLYQHPNAIIVFDQITGLSKDNTLEVSFNRLSLEKIKNRWFVIDNVEAPASSPKTDRPSNIAQTTVKTTQNELRQFITTWAQSWEEGNMDAYRSCYSPGFRSQGMDLNAWIDHKTAVRKKSKYIKIRIDKLRISYGHKQSTAVFTQHYSSNLLNSKGVKQLELKKVNNQWKIHRETIR